MNGRETEGGIVANADANASNEMHGRGGTRDVATTPARHASNRQNDDRVEGVDELDGVAVGSGPAPGSKFGGGEGSAGPVASYPRSFTLWGPAPPMVRRWMFRELHPSRTYVDVKECSRLEIFVITFFVVIRPMYARFA